MSESSFVKISSKHPHSQIVRARELKIWKNAQLPPSLTCHVSHVTCHISHVTCHVSHVTCKVSGVRYHMSHLLLFLFFRQWVELVGRVSVKKRSQPRLVITVFVKIKSIIHTYIYIHKYIYVYIYHHIWIFLFYLLHKNNVWANKSTFW